MWRDGARVHADGLRTIALTGQPAPGTTDLEFAYVGPPILNEAGMLAFGATLSGPGVTGRNNSGIWVFGDGLPRLVIRNGDPAPGLHDVTLSRTFYLSMNGMGRVSFASTLDGFGVDSTNDEAIWSDADGSLRMIARLGEPALGTNASFKDFFFPSINDAGEIAFAAGVTPGASGDYGNWVARDGSLDLVATRGMEAIGFEDGQKFAVTFGPVLSRNGNIAFGAITDGYSGNPQSPDIRGLWLERNGSIGLVVRSGMRAPGTDGGSEFTNFSNVTHCGDQVTFIGTLGFNNAIGIEGDGIWRSNAGDEPQLVLLGQKPPPGLPEDASIFGIDELRSNLTGDVAFTGWLASNSASEPETRAIFSLVDENLTVVATHGGHPPGTPEGTKFWSSSIAQNEGGQVAFFAMLMGGDVKPPTKPGMPPQLVNDHGIWGQDRSGRLRLVVRAGEMLDVDDGSEVDLRRIRSIQFRQQGFNANGDLAFSATFEDGTSGVFISNLLSVPEPSSIAAMTSGLAIVLVGFMRCKTRAVRGGHCRGGINYGNFVT